MKTCFLCLYALFISILLCRAQPGPSEGWDYSYMHFCYNPNTTRVYFANKPHDSTDYFGPGCSSAVRSWPVRLYNGIDSFRIFRYDNGPYKIPVTTFSYKDYALYYNVFYSNLRFYIVQGKDTLSLRISNLLKSDYFIDLRKVHIKNLKCRDYLYIANHAFDLFEWKGMRRVAMFTPGCYPLVRWHEASGKVTDAGYYDLTAALYKMMGIPADIRKYRNQAQYHLTENIRYYTGYR